MRTFKTNCLVFLLAAFSVTAIHAQMPVQPENITIDAGAPSHPFPHFWEKMFGSGRAILTLRDSYRRDLREVKQVTDFQYVRFHAIFHDEVGVYQEDGQGHPIYNFSYVDQIYDGLLANQVKPFVELSFMPNQLAAKSALHSFWYKPSTSPPKDWQKWDDLVAAFAKHLIDRYGVDEVASWYFEVWNEPNIDFWSGDPKQETYWQLYDHTARAIKGVSPRLRIGGPATAQAAWVDVFIQHCAANHIPLDFISTHVYGNDTSKDVFGTDENIPREKMVCRAAKNVHEQIKSSVMPGLPLIWSEFNASYKNEPEVTDSLYMGPWLADTIRQCDGLVDVMSYWTFSDVFEEQGVVKTPFYGGYGLIAAGDIPKPAYVAFELLHKLGDQRIDLASDSGLLTRKRDGSLVLALWNYTSPDHLVANKSFTLHFKRMKPGHASIWYLDVNHGDTQLTYEKLDKPRYPTQADIQQMRKEAGLSIYPDKRKISGDTLNLTLPSEGLVLIKLN
jgi:xylan 1,4-beta-xylosidase